MSESLAEYSALKVMEKKYGEDMLRKDLRYELDRYLRGRAVRLARASAGAGAARALRLVPRKGHCDVRASGLHRGGESKPGIAEFSGEEPLCQRAVSDTPVRSCAAGADTSGFAVRHNGHV